MRVSEMVEARKEALRARINQASWVGKVRFNQAQSVTRPATNLYKSLRLGPVHWPSRPDQLSSRAERLLADQRTGQPSGMYNLMY